MQNQSLNKNQSQPRVQQNNSESLRQSEQKGQSLTLEQARNIMREFVDQRQWHHFHTPRNLLLALVGQVGEVSQIFQWKGEVKNGLPQFSQKQKTHVGQQLADVFSYLIRLSDVCGIDLSKAFEDKVQKNRNKYPKDLVKGSSKKYSQYKLQAKQNKTPEQ